MNFFMGTSFDHVSSQIFDFTLALIGASRVCTMQQVARHRELSWRRQPERRAREFLAPYRESFEVLPWLRNKPYLWRLTDKEKRKRGIEFKNVGPSQHTEHWLALGDLWMNMVFSGKRPQKWFTEGMDIGRFDVFMEVMNTPFLIEVQLTALSDKEWSQKWHRRVKWLQQRKWNEPEWSSKFSSKRPEILLVTSRKMDLKIDKTIPKGVYVANTFSEFVPLIRRLTSNA